MLVIGLTGGSGTGKTTFGAAFSKDSVALIDADAVYHELTDRPSPCTAELASTFGEDILAPDGSLSRARMRLLVFGDTEAHAERRSILNGITHRYVKEEIDRRLELYREAGMRAALLDVPLLFESGLEELCDTVVAIIAPREDRIRRIMARDGITEEEATARISAQPPDSFYAHRADYLIHNSGDRAHLTARAEEIAAELLGDKES